jgi:hypothetical protein
VLLVPSFGSCACSRITPGGPRSPPPRPGMSCCLPRSCTPKRSSGLGPPRGFCLPWSKAGSPRLLPNPSVIGGRLENKDGRAICCSRLSATPRSSRLLFQSRTGLASRRFSARRSHSSRPSPPPGWPPGGEAPRCGNGRSGDRGRSRDPIRSTGAVAGAGAHPFFSSPATHRASPCSPRCRNSRATATAMSRIEASVPSRGLHFSSSSPSLTSSPARAPLRPLPLRASSVRAAWLKMGSAHTRSPFTDGSTYVTQSPSRSSSVSCGSAGSSNLAAASRTWSEPEEST